MIAFLSAAGFIIFISLICCFSRCLRKPGVKESARQSVERNTDQDTNQHEDIQQNTDRSNEHELQIPSNTNTLPNRNQYEYSLNTIDNTQDDTIAKLPTYIEAMQLNLSEPPPSYNEISPNTAF